MKLIAKKGAEETRPQLVKLITLLEYDVFTNEDFYRTPFYQSKGSLIWIRDNSGDYVVAEYEGKKPFYEEISDYIRENLPDIGGYLLRSFGNIEGLFKTNAEEPIFYSATDRNNRIFASFYVCRNDRERVEKYSVRIDIYSVSVSEAKALKCLHDYMYRQMEDNTLLRDCCLCYQADNDSVNYSKELGFLPESLKNGIYYKYF